MLKVVSELLTSLTISGTENKIVKMKPERRRKSIIRLGIHNGQAYAWSRTRMKGWAVAQSPILVTTITLERLVKRGYEP